MTNTNEFEFDAKAIADGIRRAAQQVHFEDAVPTPEPPPEPEDEDLVSVIPTAYMQRMLRDMGYPDAADPPAVKLPSKQHYTEQDLVEEISEILHDIESMTLGKHSNYGRNLQRHGLRGIVIRMSDKMMRLENMVLGGREDAVGEAIEDTLRDLIGYPLKALALLALGDLTLEGEWADQNGMTHRMHRGAP